MPAPHRRRVGDFTVTTISEGTSRFAIAGLMRAPAGTFRDAAGLAPDGSIRLGFNFLHIAGPGVSALVDTGFGDRDPHGASAYLDDFDLAPRLDAQLAHLGVRPEDVTHVLITHMHGEHFAGTTRDVPGGMVPRYPNARVVVMAAEWAISPQHTLLGEFIGTQMRSLEAAGVVDLAQADLEVVPGLDYLAAPGETVGSAVVRVAGSEGPVYYVGDLVHVAAELAHPDWYLGMADPAVLATTRRRLVDVFLREGAVVVATHHPFPGALRLRAEDGVIAWADAE